MNAEGKSYLIASCSMGLGLVCGAGAGVLLITTLAWRSVTGAPQLPTVLFFAALLLLTYGCHKLDCVEDELKRKR
ncbi:MAG: hypothetical protein ACJ73D_01980 [Pyrinomonadaceae bacterium]